MSQCDGLEWSLFDMFHVDQNNELDEFNLDLNDIARSSQDEAHNGGNLAGTARPGLL